MRPADPADAASAARVLVASITELCAPDHRGDKAEIARWTANKTPACVAGMIAAGGMWMAEQAGEIVGVGQVNTARGEVTLLYVAPAARGTGVSTAVLRRLEKTALAAGIETVRLDTTITARAFCLARGWQHDPEGTDTTLVKRLAP